MSSICLPKAIPRLRQIDFASVVIQTGCWHAFSCSLWRRALCTGSSTDSRAREVFAVPPWHLLTLVPHASLASVRPLMRPSHAGRQIRETRLPASVSNWSPQQPDLLLPRAVIGGPRRKATSTSSVIAGILAWMPSRPSGFRRRPQRTIVCHLQLADSKYHERSGLVPEAWSHVLPKSPIAPKMETPRKSGGLQFAFSARWSPTHCVTSGRLWCTTRLRDHLCETHDLSY